MKSSLKLLSIAFSNFNLLCGFTIAEHNFLSKTFISFQYNKLRQNSHLMQIASIDVNGFVGGCFLQNLFTGKFLKGKFITNRKSKVRVLSESDENGL